MSGATYAKNIGKDVGPLAVESYTKDGIVVVEHVPKRLGVRQLVRMGGSWGSRLLMDALRPLWKEMLTFEAARLLAWEIPMFCFQGELDITTPTVLAKEYFEEIKAPAKEFAVIPGAGHAMVFFADELLRWLNTPVRPRVMETKWVR